MSIAPCSCWPAPTRYASDTGGGSGREAEALKQFAAHIFEIQPECRRSRRARVAERSTQNRTCSGVTVS